MMGSPCSRPQPPMPSAPVTSPSLGPRPPSGMLLEPSPGPLLHRAGTQAPRVILSVQGGRDLSCAALAPGSGDTHSLPTAAHGPPCRECGVLPGPSGAATQDVLSAGS